MSRWSFLNYDGFADSVGTTSSPRYTSLNSLAMGQSKSSDCELMLRKKPINITPESY